MEKDKEM